MIAPAYPARSGLHSVTRGRPHLFARQATQTHRHSIYIRCDPDESEWRVEGGELVIELRKAQWREWLVPLTAVVGGGAESGGGGGGGGGAVPAAAATGAPAARPPAAVTAYPPPVAARGGGAVQDTGQGTGTSLGSQYAEWDRFDQVPNPDPGPHPNPNPDPSPNPLLSGRLLEAVRLLRRDLHNNAAQACL